MAKRKSIDFEKSLQELESLVQRMEAGELSLEESLAAFEAGIKLTRDCQQALANAEQKVQLLLVEQQGQATLTDFPEQEDSNA